MKALTLLSAAVALLALPGAVVAQEPQRGGTLNWAIAAEPPTYDCHGTGTFAVMQRMAPHYSTLLKFEPGNYPNIVGDLAQSWTTSPDNLTYTFNSLLWIVGALSGAVGIAAAGYAGTRGVLNVAPLKALRDVA